MNGIVLIPWVLALLGTTILMVIDGFSAKSVNQYVFFFAFSFNCWSILMVCLVYAVNIRARNDEFGKVIRGLSSTLLMSLALSFILSFHQIGISLKSYFPPTNSNVEQEVGE